MVYGQNLPWRNLGPAAVRAQESGGAGVSSTLMRRTIGALPMVRSVSTIRQLSSRVLAAKRRASIGSTPTVGRGGLISLRDTFSTLAPPGGLKRDRRKDKDEDAKEAESKRSLEKEKGHDKSGKKKDKKQKTEVAEELNKKRDKEESKAVAPGEGTPQPSPTGTSATPPSGSGTSPKDRTALRLHSGPASVFIKKGDDATNSKKKAKWIKSYSNMSLQDAEKRLGFEFQSIKVISVSNLIAIVGSDIFKDAEGAAVLKKMKEKIYNNIVDHIGFEGYPSESTADFNEANVSDLVYAIIGPVLSCLRRYMGRDLRLRREREIVSVDGKTGGKEEFVVIDVVSLTERKYVLVAEGKTGSIREALKQCLLSMKDMWDNNNDGEVYGFVTTGESWRVFRYNGVLFEGSRKMDVLFLGMEEDGGMDEWMLNYSAIVDCLASALIKGGIVKKEGRGCGIGWVAGFNF